MCRGCQILVEGEYSCGEYLDWLNLVQGATAQLKKAEKLIFNYQSRINRDQDRKEIDKFRRKLIKLRKQINKADGEITIPPPPNKEDEK